ncbi:DUF2975 domain-containing protein [Maribacter sp.]|uniref:DUF2975 domain-containing protein n=1 Tax=Maribacter sp. TaxID=1897614 RepID=UPI0025C6114D|nr:DUF2975 domain-containing protein [Maribacter sp.]
MTKNRLLNVAIVFTRILRIFYGLGFIVLMGFFIHFQAYPEVYKNFELVKREKGIENKVIFDNLTFAKKQEVSTQKSDVEVSNNKKSFLLVNITSGALFFNFLKYSFILVFYFLATKEFENVIQSVKKIKTFRNANILSFKKMGKCFFGVFILSSYSYCSLVSDDHIYIHSNFNLSFTSLFFMVFALVIGEVFKEGNGLMEENELTV